MPGSVAVARRAGVGVIDVMGALWARHGVRAGGARGLPTKRGDNSDFRSPLWRVLAYGEGSKVERGDTKIR